VSQIASTTPGFKGAGGAVGATLDVTVRGTELISQIGSIPDAVVGALRVRVLDMMAHHRSSVGKKVAQDFRNKRGAQKLWFARSFQYTDNKAVTIGQVAGGSFAVGLEKGARSIWESLQVGGRVAASGVMLIPFKNISRSGRESWDNFAREFGPDGGGHIDASRFGITPQGYVYEKRIGGGRRRGAAVMIGARGGPVGPGSVRFLGVARRARSQPKLLRFFETFEDIQSRHSSEIDRIFDLAITAAGRITLAEETPVKLDKLAERLAGHAPGGRAPAVRKAAAVAAAATKLNPIIDITPGRGGRGA
jgi:hypothetical protein